MDYLLIQFILCYIENLSRYRIALFGEVQDDDDIPDVDAVLMSGEYLLMSENSLT